MGGVPEYWLMGGVIALNSGAENGFKQEVDRVVDLLGEDEAWLAWWRGISEAPVLEVQLLVLKAEHTLSPDSDERVRRGRKRHVVRLARRLRSARAVGA